MKILFSLISSLLILSYINSQALDELEEIKSLKLLEDKKIEGCWLKAYGRGVGKPITSCNNPSEEKSGWLCYPKCEKGYSGAGPVCWLDCPSNFRDDGAFCYKPKPYGRGVGYAYWNKNKCNQENKQGCEKWGLMHYPKCMENFHNVACCICSPNCPKDMTDIGISCAKKSYGRGVGTPLECAAGLEYDAGLCYPKCDNGWKHVGPVCWGGSVGGQFTKRCTARAKSGR